MRFIIMMICFLVLTVFASIVYANPYLACNPMTPEVARIDVELNGQLIHVDAADIVKRSDAWLLVDLSTIGGGSYTAKARADYGDWGQSDWTADFLFVKPVINVPANTRLETQP